jgi:hypothetical protein
MILAVNSSGCNTTTYIPAVLPCHIFITIEDSSYVHFESSPIEKSMSLPHSKVREISDEVSGDHQNRLWKEETRKNKKRELKSNVQNSLSHDHLQQHVWY